MMVDQSVYARFYLNRPKIPLPIHNVHSSFRIWKGIYYAWDDFYDSHTTKINQLICAGIPSKLRGRIWVKLLQIEPLLLKNPELYKVFLIFYHFQSSYKQFCTAKPSEEDYSIQKDIGRTFPGNPFPFKFNHRSSGIQDSQKRWVRITLILNL
jgi:hypothetical protein